MALQIGVGSCQREVVGNGHVHSNRRAWTLESLFGKTCVVSQTSLETGETRKRKSASSCSQRREATEMMVQKSKGDRL